MSPEIATQVRRRRTFAIISHPDAGKTIMLNPHIATQILEGREAEIETQLDTTRADHYGFPDTLWELAASGTQSWLPPVKGADWKPMDI